MPAGFSPAARLLAIQLLTNRSIQVRLHYGDPGNAGTSNGINVSNGYAHVHIIQGGMTREGTGDTSRFSNTSDINFAAASGGNWGDGSSDQPVSWISLWYDADDATNTISGNFDTFMGAIELASSQQVNDGDPFVIRAMTLDLFTSNPT